MPVITYQGAVMSKEKKKELVAELTAKAVAVTETPSHFFVVTIH